MAEITRKSFMALRGAALCLRRATSGPHDVPGRNLLSQFADYAMQKGGEDGWVRVPGLGLTGVDFHPPVLIILVVRDGGGRTHQCLLCIFFHVDCSRTNFQGGPRLVSIRL